MQNFVLHGPSRRFSLLRNNHVGTIQYLSKSMYSLSLSLLNKKWRDNIETYKDNVAVIQDDHKITYNELDKRINSLCYLLKYKYNLQKGDKLMHLSGTRIDDLQISMSCTKLGIIYVSIPAVSETQLNGMISNIRPKLIINEPQFNNIMPPLIDINNITLTEEFDPHNWLANEYIDCNIDDNDYEHIYHNDKHHIVFTSGTTGKPKGILYSHDSVYYNSIIVYTKYIGKPTYIDSTLVLSPTVGANGVLHRWAILLDGSTIIYPNKYKIQDAQHWHYLCENKYPQISRILLFGTTLNKVCILNKKFNNLKYILYSGDFIPFKTISYVKRNLVSPDTIIINGYGCSETLWISHLDPDILNELIDNNNKDADINIPVGVPITNKCLIKINENEEIIVKKEDGSGMIEYFNAPQLTSSVMTNDGWINTGDIGYIDSDNGLLYLLGRNKDIIKDGARFTVPIEIETVILTHNEVNEAAVVGYPNSIYNDNKYSIGEIPVAFVSLKNNISEYKIENIDKIEKELFKLTDDKLISQVTLKKIFFIDNLPKTNATKMNKNLLRTQIIDGLYRI